jgi:hypothetical protein
MEEEPETETEISAAASNMKIYLCTIHKDQITIDSVRTPQRGPACTAGSFNLIPVPATSTTPKRYSMGECGVGGVVFRRAATYLAVKSRNRGRCAAAVKLDPVRGR